MDLGPRTSDWFSYVLQATRPRPLTLIPNHEPALTPVRYEPEAICAVRLARRLALLYRRAKTFPLSVKEFVPSVA
jgi:hypothetical protein